MYIQPLYLQFFIISQSLVMLKINIRLHYFVTIYIYIYNKYLIIGESLTSSNEKRISQCWPVLDTDDMLSENESAAVHASCRAQAELELTRWPGLGGNRRSLTLFIGGGSTTFLLNITDGALSWQLSI